MKVVKTRLNDCVIIEPKVYGDHRGFFLETFQAERYAEQAGITLPFVQDNHSRSGKGVLRGLHFQVSKPQGKLVRVVQGEVFDVAVDLRPQSSSFGQWAGVTLSETADFEYKCTDYYDPKDEGSLSWNDQDLAIDWPEGLEIKLSDKDAHAPSFKEFLNR